MDADAFWQLVEEVKQGSGEPGSDDASVEARTRAHLTERLARLPPDAILAFHEEFSRRVNEAYRFDLMAVADVVNGGVGGEDYDAFVGWLIEQGRAYFDEALADPRRAADRAPAGHAKSRALWHAPRIAYRRATGRDEFDLEAKPISLVMEGERLDKDAMEAQFAALIHRFGWSPPPAADEDG